MMDMLIIFFIIISFAVALLVQDKIEEHLEDQARKHANDVFSDCYFDTKPDVGFRQTLELRGNRLIHRKRSGKTTINLYQVERVDVHYLWLAVRLKNRRTVRLPLRFKHLAEIVAILKYHRPDETRRTFSTRHS